LDFPPNITRVINSRGLSVGKREERRPFERVWRMRLGNVNVDIKEIKFEGID
jgi:hypothetical protein